MPSYNEEQGTNRYAVPPNQHDRSADNAQSVNERLYEREPSHKPSDSATNMRSEPINPDKIDKAEPQRYRFKDGVWLKAEDYDRVVEELQRNEADGATLFEVEAVLDDLAPATRVDKTADWLRRELRAREARAEAAEHNFAVEHDAQLAAEREVERLRDLLAVRERQLGFTDECAAHGRAYSPYCGACTISQRIATLEGKKDA